jgi:hypothetical protein
LIFFPSFFTTNTKRKRKYFGTGLAGKKLDDVSKVVSKKNAMTSAKIVVQV